MAHNAGTGHLSSTSLSAFTCKFRSFVIAPPARSGTPTRYPIQYKQNACRDGLAFVPWAICRAQRGLHAVLPIHARPGAAVGQLGPERGWLGDAQRRHGLPSSVSLGTVEALPLARSRTRRGVFDGA